METKTRSPSMPYPQNIYINNCKIVNYLTANRVPIQSMRASSLLVIPKKQICIDFSLMTDCNQPLFVTAFDLAVMDAVYTLVVKNCWDFTPGMLVKTIWGHRSCFVTSQKLLTVNTSLEKLSAIRANINCTAEFQFKKIIDKDHSVKFNGPLLSISAVPSSVDVAQRLKTLYHIRDKPVLHAYAEITKQIICIPTNLLTCGNLPDTEEVILIKRYLFKRIEMIKNQKNHIKSRRISYEWFDTNKGIQRGLLYDLGYDKSDYVKWRDKKAKIHCTVVSVLDAFVAAGYIAGYQVVRQPPGGKTSPIMGVDLSL